MLNRSLQFSVLLLLAVSLIANISIRHCCLRHSQIDPRWRDEVFYDCEELENKPSVTFEIWFREDERRERILGGFGEKETNRSGLVVLATEPLE